MKSIVYRLTTADDIPSIIALANSTGVSTWSDKDIYEELEQSNAILFSALAPGTGLVGYIHMRLITDSSIFRDIPQPTELEILNIAVNEQFRHQTIAGTLLSNAFRGLESGQEALVHLEVRESNEAAISFYISQGFEIVGKRTAYYAKPSENAILMRFGSPAADL